MSNMINQKLTWYELTWDRPFTVETIEKMLKAIAAQESMSYIAFEARGKAGQITYLVGVRSNYAKQLAYVLQSQHIGELTETDPKRAAVKTCYRLTVNKPVLSLNYGEAEDAIRGALQALASTSVKSEIVVQVILGGGYLPSESSGKLQDPHQSLLDLALFGIREASAQSVKSAADKSEQHTFNVAIRIGIGGTHPKAPLESLWSSFRLLSGSGAKLIYKPDNPEHLNSIKLPWVGFRLSVKEIIPFLAPPVGEENYSGIPNVHPKRLLPPKWYQAPADPASSRFFAQSLNATPQKLSISPQDSLEHTIILGPTGSGKSTLMEHLILSDINAGRSVLVIDPKADLVTHILERIPDKRKDDVIIIDPSSTNPVGFNPLKVASYGNKELTAQAILAVMQEIFSDSWGVRTQHILTHTFQTLVGIPGATIMWIPEFLNNKAFRKKVLEQCYDLRLRRYWDTFDDKKDSERENMISPVLNKMGQFSSYSGLRSVLGQSDPKFDLMDLFLKRKIVLVPLNKGVIGPESARLLGSLMVGLTWTQALSRANVAPEKRHLVSLYIDELQDYLRLPTDLSDALAQARGLGVGIIMAHQYRRQVPLDTRSAIDANARNKIVFGLSSEDAQEVVRQAPGLKPEDFMLLPRFQIYANIMQGKRQTGWMQGVTLPPLPAIRDAKIVKAECEKMYGVSAEEVDKDYITMLKKLEKKPEPEKAKYKGNDIKRERKS